MSGRRGTAPCGHEGEYIFGSYVKCLSGCDSGKKPTAVPASANIGHIWIVEGNLQRCAKCHVHKFDSGCWLHGPVRFGAMVFCGGEPPQCTGAAPGRHVTGVVGCGFGCGKGCTVRIR